LHLEIHAGKIIWNSDMLERIGISKESLISTALELLVPHPEFEEKEMESFLRGELDAALKDPNVCILIYAAFLLEKSENLPGRKLVQEDSSGLVADEVLGLSIATYLNGYKAVFEYVRYDRKKPGILKNLGPFMDDAIAGLIGGITSRIYDRILR
jgi:alpha-ribazole phosphatase CobZ